MTREHMPPPIKEITFREMSDMMDISYSMDDSSMAFFTTGAAFHTPTLPSTSQSRPVAEDALWNDESQYRDIPPAPPSRSWAGSRFDCECPDVSSPPLPQRKTIEPDVPDDDDDGDDHHQDAAFRPVAQHQEGASKRTIKRKTPARKRVRDTPPALPRRSGAPKSMTELEGCCSSAADTSRGDGLDMSQIFAKTAAMRRTILTQPAPTPLTSSSSWPSWAISRDDRRRGARALRNSTDDESGAAPAGHGLDDMYAIVDDVMDILQLDGR